MKATLSEIAAAFVEQECKDLHAADFQKSLSKARLLLRKRLEEYGNREPEECEL